MPEPTDFEQRLAFLDLTDQDLERLAELRPLLEEKAPEFVAAFYRKLLSFPPTRQLLRDPEIKDRLVGVQREYVLSLSHPTLDEKFVAGRRAIGSAHARVGLEPRWYIGAYSLYLSLLTPLISEAYEVEPQKGSAILVSVGKLLFLDLQIAMEAYIERQQQQLEFLTDELSKEGRRLAQDYESQKAELRITEDRARAAEALASVATLVAGLAHEIGTPMGVIQGHAKLLEAAVSDEDATWRLRTIQEQVGRISKIIQTLLNIARPGKTQHVPVELAPLLENTLYFLEQKLSRRQIRTETCGDPVPSVLGDSERLQQLFLNLFLNAADSMPDGGDLRITLEPAGEDEVEIRIADSGHGIAERDMDRIFEPFFTSKDAGEGNGLGLMVVKGIVTDHGGSIEATSEVGVGTEFRILLPAARPAG
ncbi:MAG: protoglobin domain-containing protein [Myxococcota bacterium]